LNKNSKKNNKGCISGILGTLYVILGILAYSIIASLFNRLIIGARLGGQVAGAIMTNTFTGITIAFVLYEVIFVVWQIKLSRAAAGIPDEKGTMKRVMICVFAGCIALSLAVAAFFSNTYTELREDSISSVFVTNTKEYRWDERNDVLRYTFSCDEGGGLTFKVIMKDGKSFDILGGVSSLSSEFIQKYNTTKVNLLGYVAHLSEQFDNSDYYIEKKISGIDHMEKIYKEASPEIWAEISKIIASEIDE
jgi:hypothetical protein